MAEDWTWRDTVKEWMRWSAIDSLVEVLRAYAGRTTIADIIAAAVVAYAYVKGHPELLLLGLGAVVALSLILLIGLAQRRPDKEAATSEPMPSPKPKTAQEWSEYRLERVANQKFEHCEVPVDGKRFVNCRFVDASLLYDGTAPVAFTECEFDSSTRHRIHTHNPAITHFLDLLREFGRLADGMAPEEPPTSTGPRGKAG